MAIGTPIKGENTADSGLLSLHPCAKGALFKLNGPAVSDGSAPVMTGNFEIASQSKLPVKAFLKKGASSGSEYLNLQIGDEKTGIYYGRLFRNIPKFRNNSPDFTGYVSLGDTANSPQLRLAGWELFHGDPPSPYISLEIGAPQTPKSVATNAKARNGFPI